MFVLLKRQHTVRRKVRNSTGIRWLCFSFSSFSKRVCSFTSLVDANDLFARQSLWILHLSAFGDPLDSQYLKPPTTQYIMKVQTTISIALVSYLSRLSDGALRGHEMTSRQLQTPSEQPPLNGICDTDFCSCRAQTECPSWLATSVDGGTYSSVMKDTISGGNQTDFISCLGYRAGIFENFPISATVSEDDENGNRVVSWSLQDGNATDAKVLFSYNGTTSPTPMCPQEVPTLPSLPTSNGLCNDQFCICAPADSSTDCPEWMDDVTFGFTSGRAFLPNSDHVLCNRINSNFYENSPFGLSGCQNANCDRHSYKLFDGSAYGSPLLVMYDQSNWAPLCPTEKPQSGDTSAASSPARLVASAAVVLAAGLWL